MKKNLIRLLSFVLILAMGGFLVMCNTIEEERVLPSQDNATVVEPEATVPVIDMCDYYGTVVKIPELEEECGLNILLDNGEWLLPHSFMEPFELIEGQRLKVSYDQLDIWIPNCKGMPVVISCVFEVPDLPPPDLCVNQGVMYNFVDCGYVIKDLKDGTLYEPLNLHADWAEGEAVEFGFYKVDAPDAGCGAQPIIITCIR